MKHLILALAVAAIPMAAHAQQTVPPRTLAPVGPYTFGMSMEAARAASAPGAEWDIIDDDVLQRGSIRSRTPALQMHDTQFRVHLSYAANALTFVRLSTELPLARADCAARHRALVEAEMPTRGPFSGRPYWHRFYHEPEAPSGRMEGDEFIAAPSEAVNGTTTTISDPAGGYNSVIVSFAGAETDQAFYVAIYWQGEIAARWFNRAGSPVCSLAIQGSNQRGSSGGFKPSSGPSGAERLAERLAAASFIRPLVYLTSPEGSDFARHYPPRAMDQELGGDVTLSCLILADGELDCAVAAETPPDMGFGEAAQRIARANRIDVFAGDFVGKRTELTTRFRMGD